MSGPAVAVIEGPVARAEATPARGRGLHPLAWWAWAAGIAVAITRTQNPLVIALLLAAVVLVVTVCRDESPWARAFGAYLILGLVVVAVRVAFYVVVGLPDSSPVLIDLPTVPLPDWVDSLTLLGPVHTAGLLGAIYAGLRLAALIITFGAANALANPKRALRSVPASLHHLSTAVVIAVTVTPQLFTAVGRVRRAQRLRGLDARGPRAFAGRLIPVLQDALDRSLDLAASMDSRGYARGTTPGGGRHVTAALVVALVAGVLGTYALLDGAAPAWLGAVGLGVGAVVAVAASVRAGRRVDRTRYRPDPWGLRENLVAGCGIVAATAVVLGGWLDPGTLSAGLTPPTWPTLNVAGVVAALAAIAPATIGGGRR
ncbi:energy-coupling factor transporter transmembrane protein EcfT [Occultella glacieicola]|uniref:Energy-coupling factor transporter transmembrane protein EcfT n=1 Tax=Occultella glacieicola TaxID=2518684 RepID=A0ABY2E5U6_9MICO|nr:energy-coupling factor transporter transmembrane component T [Occultella glacieicola]TDE95957.1 energy-coupling factor transporter transmembrane protein EcfT [Occultella glacieicola]